MPMSRDEMIAQIQMGRSPITYDIRDAEGTLLYRACVASTIDMLPDESLLARVDPEARKRQADQNNRDLERLLAKKKELDDHMAKDNARIETKAPDRAEANAAIQEEAAIKAAEEDKAKAKK